MRLFFMQKLKRSRNGVLGITVGHLVKYIKEVRQSLEKQIQYSRIQDNVAVEQVEHTNQRCSSTMDCFLIDMIIGVRTVEAKAAQSWGTQKAQDRHR